MNCGELLRGAVARLGGDSPRADAELLLAHVLGRDRAWLFAHADAACDPDQAARFDALLARRAAGEPVAYLVGHRGFWTLDLAVGPGVLVPRPETELLVEFALAHAARESPVAVLDLGTGSGAIALAVASERPRADVVAVDASAEALAIARANAGRLGLSRVAFLHGDWFAPVAGRRFDLVLANPPYIADDDPHLARGDLRFEPRGALAAGADGLDAIRHIAAAAPAHLAPGGRIAIEHGFAQAGAVRALLEATGLREAGTLRDLAGHERITHARAPD
ncbi:MAG: peptide chain release factor N(5)-glutamine methyltransferase [Xanthomonadaceae bacterium]|jgi:release factor glutamine methyltransferase|nr:peptide chain release factor N(5)-glutamine methyltransferase [Xanthomonadaceae bacterium]